MKLQRSAAAALVATALLAAGCADRGGTESETSSNSNNNTQATPVSSDFGDLTGLCKDGSPSGSPAQGVSDKEIKLGVMSDVGFTKNSEFADAAKVFTGWCNDAGGINGRKVTANTRDTKMMEVQQRMVESCDKDFALVGGGSAMDALGTKARLECLLPDFPAQISQTTNVGSDLQVSVQPGGRSWFTYAGYFSWLIKEAYPQSAGAVGLINGDSPVTKVIGAQTEEGLRGVGANVVYSELYPAAGVSDWTPYAQSIKSKGVRGLVYNGSFSQLAKLEQALTAIDYKLDWIDTNSNAYTPDFIQLAGSQALNSQNNVADLGGVFPLDNAAANPATKQLVDLYAKYAPGAKLTYPAIKAFSAWLLFAKSASSCGDDLTRKCVYDAALKETSWTGGGLQAPTDLSNNDRAVTCFNVEKATTDGWKPADFGADNTGYRCNAVEYKYTGDYGKALTLADVGKSAADFK
ncbi:ABC transporter substrate-binding protein [Yinghuangia sp. ASG 101]|uniref:ABC transporter substrate-binding protein n=1 Tax=Yinghuangia sp. ASG 101 TaxID=2896848 RepID=UPI001E455519|nr:ABC transporter substrate-binding protein [Yinghuangia sp. ASG 101]UGQ12625.1 ABC transporter substrate-binding protein [Yinghuangia sp. ASG 101]